MYFIFVSFQALLFAVGAVSANPGYGYYGYYPHAASHVDVARPYGSYGYGIHHLGKREAEPEADASHYGYYGYPYAAYYLPSAVSHTAVSTPFAAYSYGVHNIGKREAEAEPGYGYYYGYPAGLALHPWGGSSYSYRSVQGIGKRSADAEAEPGYFGYGYFGYPYGYSASHVSSITPFAAYGYGVHHG